MNAAEYKDAELIMDADREAFYELSYNETTKIYYAYSNSRHALFIEHNENISSVLIESEGTSLFINQTISKTEYTCLIKENILEITIKKNEIKTEIFMISINDQHPILIDESKGNVGIDLVSAVSGFFLSGWFWGPFAALVLIIADYNNHPTVKVQDTEGNKINLGRFIHDEENKQLLKRKFTFMSGDGTREIYCNYAFRALDQFLFQKVYVIQWDYPHLILTKLKIPEQLQFKQKIRKKGLGNLILWGLFKFFSHTAFRHFAMRLLEAIKYDYKMIKEVDYLIPFVSMNSNQYSFDIKYQREILDPKTKQMKKEETNELDICFADLQARQKEITSDFIITRVKVKNIEYTTLKEAQQNKKSLFEVISNYEYRTTSLELAIINYEKRLQESYNTIQNQRIEFDQKVRANIKPYEESSENLRSNFPDMLSNALNFRALGFNEKESIQKAIVDYLGKNDKEKEDLREEINNLKAKLSETPKEKPRFNPSEFIIREEGKSNG